MPPKPMKKRSLVDRRKTVRRQGREIPVPGAEVSISFKKTPSGGTFANMRGVEPRRSGKDRRQSK